MSESRIEEAFEDGPAFIPYLAAGDPNIESTKEYVRALVRGGADIVELGLPFSEPIAEGSTIQNAIGRSLEGGMTPEAYFELIEDLALDVPVVCMTYYNLIYRYGKSEALRASDNRAAQARDEEGPDSFVRRAAEVGIDGFVVPDLPAEESDPLREACDAHGLDLIFIVAPTTRGERLERIMNQVSGYVYVQARLGTTGARTDVSDQTDTSLGRLREWDVPKAVGFGISEREHAERIVAGGADGIIVGSALVEIVSEGNTEERTVTDHLESKARELKEGALAGATNRAQSERP
jgi:tryptophan synthase alpha chain